MIGEQFDRGDEICGAVVNVRARQEKVSFLKQINPPAFIIILSLLFVPICFFSAAVEHWETVEGVSRLQ